ncbi:MAG: hypothetical protein IKQ58_10620, partial [Prevotella sp.]|nr:hypothetical protein [Prevotella sp.]
LSQLGFVVMLFLQPFLDAGAEKFVYTFHAYRIKKGGTRQLRRIPPPVFFINLIEEKRVNNPNHHW